MFYPAASCGGKSILVRQLRGPHLSTWPWCSKRSSMALTAAASPSSLPQSSTGRTHRNPRRFQVGAGSFATDSGRSLNAPQRPSQSPQS